jgi:hypothetical protein
MRALASKALRRRLSAVVPLSRARPLKRGGARALNGLNIRRWDTRHKPLLRLLPGDPGFALRNDVHPVTLSARLYVVGAWRASLEH